MPISVHVIPGDTSGLEPLLGADGAQRLREVMLEHTLAVAREFAGEAAVMGGAPSGRGIVVSADVPRLSVTHLAVAALDLDEGADASFGATFDGGPYLVAMREPHPELLGVAGMEALALAAKAGLEVGLLRMERRLRTPADAAAMLADPLLPPEVRAVLTGPQ